MKATQLPLLNDVNFNLFFNRVEFSKMNSWFNLSLSEFIRFAKFQNLKHEAQKTPLTAETARDRRIDGNCVFA
jgi:hypothetical protein